MAREADFPLQNSGLHKRTSESPEDHLTISQWTKLRTPQPKPTPPAPAPAPATHPLGKRRKWKPIRYGVFQTAQKKRKSHSKANAVVGDPRGKRLSSSKESPVESLPAMVRAEEVRSSLGDEYPSCIKVMLRTYVDGGYWMGFPHTFCKLHLPRTDADMVVEDEKGEECHLRYIAQKSGLSAGWKKFAEGHNLKEGDVLVFHLVQPSKFKVYIIKGNDVDGVDDALGLANLEVRTEQMIPETDMPKRSKRPRCLPLTAVHTKQIPTSPISSHPMEQSGNDSEGVGSEVLESCRQEVLFQEVKRFEDFHIMFEGQCIDGELPDEARMTYYKMCMERKEFLHDGVAEGMYYKLVAGLIGETVHIANEMRKCKLGRTSKEEMEAWDNSLKSFGLLGMKVGFLRERIDRLRRVAFESEGGAELERYMEAKQEQEVIEEKIRQLRSKMEEVEGVVGGLKEKIATLEVKFQEEVDAPW